MWARDLGQRENTGFLTTRMTYETDPSKGQGNARSSRDGTHDGSRARGHGRISFPPACHAVGLEDYDGFPDARVHMGAPLDQTERWSRWMSAGFSQSPWLTIPQASRYVRMRDGAFRRLVKSGEIPSYRHGRTTLVSASDLDMWMRRQQSGANVIATALRQSRAAC